MIRTTARLVGGAVAAAILFTGVGAAPASASAAAVSAPASAAVAARAGVTQPVAAGVPGHPATRSGLPVVIPAAVVAFAGRLITACAAGGAWSVLFAHATTLVTQRRFASAEAVLAHAIRGCLTLGLPGKIAVWAAHRIGVDRLAKAVVLVIIRRGQR